MNDISEALAIINAEKYDQEFNVKALAQRIASIRAEARAEVLKEAAEKLRSLLRGAENDGPNCDFIHDDAIKSAIAILADEPKEREAEDALTIKQLTADLLYIGGMVERGTGKPLEQSTPITKQVLEYIKSLESRAGEPKEERGAEELWHTEPPSKEGLYLVEVNAKFSSPSPWYETAFYRKRDGWALPEPSKGSEVLAWMEVPRRAQADARIEEAGR